MTYNPMGLDLTTVPLPGRPFADQPREWRIHHAGVGIAGFVMCEEARPGHLPRAELVAWYATCTIDVADVYDEVVAYALARLADEDVNPASVTAETMNRPAS
jgi:hypothetical protein